MENIFFKDNKSDQYYFDIPNIPRAPLIPIPDINSNETLKKFGMLPGTYRYFISKNFFKLIGFNSFLKSLNDELENILQKTNFRLPGLFAPVISASLSLIDDEKKNNIIDRSVSLITAVYQFYYNIVNGKLTPDRYKENVLEMGQYPNLFSTSLRIVGKKAVVYRYDKIDKLLVICRNKYYLLTIEKFNDPDFNSKLHNSLKLIIESSEKNPLKNEELSIGYLSACNNKTQFFNFNRITKNAENLKSLNKLYQAFFTVCLEPDTSPHNYSDSLFKTQSNNYGNRWFNSALQLVVFKNSKASIICNFTVGLDGNVMMRAGSEIGKRGLAIDFKSKSTNNFYFEEIKIILKNLNYFKLNKDLRLIKDSQQATFEIMDFGLNFFNRYNLSPVQTFVIALQLTLLELINKKRVNIMQFISLNKYRFMDLDQVSVSTEEVYNFVENFNDENFDKEVKVELLKKAIDSQKEVVKKARSILNLNYAFILFIKTRCKVVQYFNLILAKLASIIMGRSRIFDMPNREVIISHPKIFPEVKAVGRPGIKIPYVKYFGLHYQIWEEKIVITVMPGINWSVPNTELIRVINKNLQKIGDLFNE